VTAPQTATLANEPLAPPPTRHVADIATDIESDDLQDIAELARQLEQRIR
jgi:hypothetical protein